MDESFPDPDRGGWVFWVALAMILLGLLGGLTLFALL
jgi:hypothetical protein